ncbi:substrate-binding domain-containing protein, partial [Streptosporangium sp. NPDC001682]
DPVTALHPREGTINLDYPYVVTSSDEAKASGSRAFAAWLRSPETQEAARRAGFRSPDGSLGPYSPGPEIPTEAPRTRPTILPGMIDEALAAWSRLAPPTNILVLADSGKHMAGPINGQQGKTRLTVALDAARLGLQLFPGSTHMGMWEFSSAKGEDQRERVRLGPITEPDDGQVIRRSRLEELTRTLRADPKEPSALYDSIIAGFRALTESYDETMNNTLLVITAGKDDGKGISGAKLVERLRGEWNPARPVQIVVLAFGTDLDRAALTQITSVTNGSLHVAQRPEEIIDVFLSALARRLCHPTCAKAP